MNVTTMVPGDSTAGVVTVKNSGTAPLKYYVDASPSNADGKGLGAALVAKVTGDTADSGSGTAVTCAGTAISPSGDRLHAPACSDSAASPRLLAPGASETVCIQATLPTNAASSLAGRDDQHHLHLHRDLVLMRSPRDLVAWYAPAVRSAVLTTGAVVGSLCLLATSWRPCWASGR